MAISARASPSVLTLPLLRGDLHSHESTRDAILAMCICFLGVLIPLRADHRTVCGFHLSSRWVDVSAFELFRASKHGSQSSRLVSCVLTVVDLSRLFVRTAPRSCHPSLCPMVCRARLPLADAEAHHHVCSMLSNVLKQLGYLSSLH